eukprot:3932834-Rhodomonas_salina.1
MNPCVLSLELANACLRLRLCPILTVWMRHSVTAFKRVCRSLGVRAWPYRFQEVLMQSHNNRSFSQPAQLLQPSSTRDDTPETPPSPTELKSVSSGTVEAPPTSDQLAMAHEQTEL